MVMKKILKYVVVALFISQSALGQNYKISFNPSDFELVENKGIVTIKTTGGKYVYAEDTSLPALPYKMVNILLPKDCELNNFTFSTKKQTFRNNVILAKNPEFISSPTHEKIKEVEGLRYDKKSYPEENVTYSNTSISRGYVYASFLITPFIYNVEQSRLDFIGEIQINITVKSAPSTIKHQYGETESLKDFFLNSNDIEKYYGANIKSESNVIDTISYLIITSQELKSSFLPLKAWKIQKGIRTDIITTNEIYSNYSGVTNQLKIKNCLKDYYENHALKYALMGGDEYIVPIQRCYGECGTLKDNTIPCDLFYACFDNQFDWDYNGNDTIGEFYYDRMDLSPEVYISRVPVRTDEHVKAFLSKTKKYELYPALTNYINKMLLAGAELSNTWDGKSDAHHWSEYIYDNYISPIWNGVKTKFYDTGTDFIGGSDYDLTCSNLQSQLNLGYHYVHMASHGYNTYWFLENYEIYSSTTASSQTNLNSSVIITSACHTNAFDNAEPCLSEAFLRNENGGCIVYWGSSREGWGYNSTSLTNYGPSLTYNRDFFQNLFSQTNSSFAKITSLTKSYYANSVNPAYIWLQYTLNAIGDPELPLYTDNPIQFSNVTITPTTTGITVNTGGISGCRIAVTSNGDFGASYFRVAENVSQATFSNLPINYIVTITKKNHVPYRSAPDIYLQNCTISSDAYYYGNNIFAGEHVTTAVPYGNVYFTNNANVTLEAENNVYLDTDVEVQSGVILNIE